MFQCWNRDWSEEVFEAYLELSETGTCEHCQHVGHMVHCESRRMDSDTSYTLCAPCAEEYHLEWDDMWSEYWRGRL